MVDVPPPPPEDDPYYDPEEAEEMKERAHFAAIIRAFDNYPRWALGKVTQLERDYRRLNPHHQRLLDTDAKIHAMRQAINVNASLLEKIIEPHRAHVGCYEAAASGSMRAPDSGDMEKVQSTLKQFVREWGAEGQPERDAAHKPILQALLRALPDGAARGARVLVPGCGLARLAWDIAALGFTSQASEFSYFMIIACNFVLNRLQSIEGGQVTVHPYVLQTCNVKERSEQMRGCLIPDTPPWSLPPSANLSFVAGDFLEVYREQEACWDAVVSMFFIDTAHDPSEYIRKIAELLIPGGMRGTPEREGTHTHRSLS